MFALFFVVGWNAWLVTRLGSSSCEIWSTAPHAHAT